MMFSYPEFVLIHSAEKQRELRAEAERYRLAASARWARKRRRAAWRRDKPAAASDQVGNLAAWTASEAPAR
jgi:hypothetical protein